MSIAQGRPGPGAQRRLAGLSAALLAVIVPHAVHAAGWRRDDPAAQILAAQLQHRLAGQGSAVRRLSGAACWPLLSAVPSGPVPKNASWRSGDISADNPYLTPQERWCLGAVTGTAASLATTSTSANPGPPARAVSAGQYPGILPPGARAVRLKGGGWQICF